MVIVSALAILLLVGGVLATFQWRSPVRELDDTLVAEAQVTCDEADRILGLA